MSVGAHALAQALRSVSYEVLPFSSTEEAVVTHVPRDVPLTVTTTETRGLAPTLDLAVRLTGAGYSVSPHLVARLVRDRHHLADVLAQVSEAGVEGLFVIGGDVAEAAGPYRDALSLLRAVAESGHRFARVGVGGYPEGHGQISDDALTSALVAKAPHATYVASQLCFRAEATLAWARDLTARGVPLPVRVGIPGAVSRQKLVRISAGLGLGASARFLAKQQSMLWRFFLPRGYSPDRLVNALVPHLGGPGQHLEGFHIYTFNALAGTESWRQRWLGLLGEQATASSRAREPGLR